MDIAEAALISQEEINLELMATMSSLAWRKADNTDFI